MIIYSNGYALAESAAGRPLSNPRIGYQTWLRDLEDSDVTASSENASGPKDAVLRPDTAEFWEPTALPATLTIALGAGRDIDYVGIAGHTIGSSGCAVSVHTSDGSSAGSPAEQVWTQFGSSVAPGDDAPLMWLASSVLGSQLRISVSGGSTMPRIASIYAGQVLAMSRPIYGGHSPMKLSRDTVLTRNLSRGGQFLGQSFRRNGQSGNAAFRHLTASWYRAYFDPFVKAARQYPFFWAWRPDDFPLEVSYAWCPDDFRPSNMGLQDLMQVSFNMQGIGQE